VSLSSDHKALALIRNGSNNICFVIFLLQALEIDKENVKAIFRRGKVWFFLGQNFSINLSFHM